jgi:hypothetical protein
MEVKITSQWKKSTPKPNCPIKSEREENENQQMQNEILNERRCVVVAAGATILDKIQTIELQRCTGLFEVLICEIGKPVILCR